jgi:hypothetical protein|nr:MAG TPA: GEMININ, MULTICILIN CYCLE, DNA REPLICATION LICENSING [Caudoviricetes sp.]
MARVKSEFDYVVDGVYWGVGKLFKAVKSGVTSTLEMLPTKENKRKILAKELNRVKELQDQHRRSLVSAAEVMYKDSDDVISTSIEEACDTCFYNKNVLLDLVKSLRDNGYEGKIFNKDIQSIITFNGLPVIKYRDLYTFKDECEKLLKQVEKRKADTKAYDEIAIEVGCINGMLTAQPDVVAYKPYLKIRGKIADFLATNPDIDKNKYAYMIDALAFSNQVVELHKAEIEAEALEAARMDYEQNLRDIESNYRAKLDKATKENAALKAKIKENDELHEEIEELNDRISELEDENSSIAEQRDMFGMFGIKQYSDNQALKDALNK